MSKFYKIVLITEVLTAFVAPAGLVMVGVIVGIPIAVMDLFAGNFNLLYVPVLTILGLMGLWGISQLTFKVFIPDIRLASRKRLFFYIISGCMGYSPAVYITFTEFEPLASILLFPYIVTAQLIHANKSSLFTDDDAQQT